MFWGFHRITFPGLSREYINRFYVDFIGLHSLGLVGNTSIDFMGIIWASPENSMWKFSYKTTTAGSKDLPRKVAMVLAKGT